MSKQIVYITGISETDSLTSAGCLWGCGAQHGMVMLGEVIIYQ